MKVAYTKHAKQRMMRRNISEYEVEETIRAPEIKSPGKRESERVLRKHIESRFIKVVIAVRDNILVITTAVAGEEG